MYHYSEADTQRLFQEPSKSNELQAAPPRNDFARDRARVLHSAALRRLADKTQVVGPRDGDTPRTRLTHSLEVAQIAREIGTALGVNPDLCELAGLTHDIGHPPYGHNGETALHEVAQDCGGFEGNAQTLRILTVLEPKIISSTGQSFGLNLTRAALDAACKYPRVRTNADGTQAKKYGCYDQDRHILEWVRNGHHDHRPSMEAQIMDFSDDIAYSVHDVEDGIVSGRINLQVLWDFVELAALAEKGARAFHSSPEALLDAAGYLRELAVIRKAADFRGDFLGFAALKAMTSTLVGRYVSAIVAATQAAYPTQVGRTHGNLVIPPQVLAEVTLLKSIAVLYVMDAPVHLERQDRQRERIFRVYDYYSAGGRLDPMFYHFWDQAETQQQQQRVIIDQIASLTESRLERIAHQAAEVAGFWG